MSKRVAVGSLMGAAVLVALLTSLIIMLPIPGSHLAAADHLYPIDDGRADGCGGGTPKDPSDWSYCSTIEREQRTACAEYDARTATQHVHKHHIATDKWEVSTRNGGPWTPKFRQMFEAAGMDISTDPLNIADVAGHRGPHPRSYHEEVFERLDDAVFGKAEKTSEYRQAFRAELAKMKDEVVQPGTSLNDGATRRSC